MDRTESNSSCRELSNGGLESVVTLLVHWQINYSCASPGKAIQLYHLYIYISIEISAESGCLSICVPAFVPLLQLVTLSTAIHRVLSATHPILNTQYNRRQWRFRPGGQSINSASLEISRPFVAIDSSSKLPSRRLYIFAGESIRSCHPQNHSFCS